MRAWRNTISSEPLPGRSSRPVAGSTTFLAICFVIVLIFALGARLVIVPIERRFANK
jgi:hypothetical protein